MPSGRPSDVGPSTRDRLPRPPHKAIPDRSQQQQSFAGAAHRRTRRVSPSWSKATPAPSASPTTFRRIDDLSDRLHFRTDQASHYRRTGRHRPFELLLFGGFANEEMVNPKRRLARWGWNPPPKAPLHLSRRRGTTPPLPPPLRCRCVGRAARATATPPLSPPPPPSPRPQPHRPPPRPRKWKFNDDIHYTVPTSIITGQVVVDMMNGDLARIYTEVAEHRHAIYQEKSANVLKDIVGFERSLSPLRNEINRLREDAQMIRQLICQLGAVPFEEPSVFSVPIE
ncbi:hypothetical protein U9M48_022328 [Paspalum notatum var. saurae]|uniref:Uncharacterized protein n=1 Tax=Paspalum notatum var. saurae TaxID=547442 RepID=A0AAQ3TLT0_PASNO